MALAIFDLDDTLIDGDCATLWSQEMAQLGWVDGDSFLRRDHELMTLYAEGKLAMEDYMAFSLSPLVGRSAQDVAQVIEPFVENVIEPLIHSDACTCLAQHRAIGNRVLIISASGMHLVAPIAQHLGVEHVLAIELEQQHGHYNGRTQGVLTYREGKVSRLLEWLEQYDESLDGAYFYSDSRNDLPLLQKVSKPHAVNPDSVLRQHAEQAGWPILHWR